MVRVLVRVLVTHRLAVEEARAAEEGEWKPERTGAVENMVFPGESQASC